MEEVLKKMQGEYDKLTSILSEATVHPESIEKFFDCKYGEIISFILHKH